MTTLLCWRSTPSKTAVPYVPEFLEKTPYTFPILYDDKGVVQKLYGVYKFPESFIVGKDGKVVEKIIGPLDWSSLKTITYLKGLIKG